MKKIFAFFLTIVLCNIGYALEKIPQDVANSYKLIGVEKTLIGVAEGMMSTQGKMVDDITQFISASASGKTISLTYKIYQRKNEINIDQVQLKILKKSIPLICKSPLSNFLIYDMDAKFTVNYYDMNNMFLFRFNFSSTNC